MQRLLKEHKAGSHSSHRTRFTTSEVDKCELICESRLQRTHEVFTPEFWFPRLWDAVRKKHPRALAFDCDIRYNLLDDCLMLIALFNDINERKLSITSAPNFNPNIGQEYHNCVVGNPAFLIGDRVMREGRFGNVIGRYAMTSQRFGYYPELYVVRWDNRIADYDCGIECSFLPHGIQKATEREK